MLNGVANDQDFVKLTGEGHNKEDNWIALNMVKDKPKPQGILISLKIWVILGDPSILN